MNSEISERLDRFSHLVLRNPSLSQSEFVDLVRSEMLYFQKTEDKVMYLDELILIGKRFLASIEEIQNQAGIL